MTAIGLIIFIGLPGSGKSSMVKKLSGSLADPSVHNGSLCTENTRYVSVTYDELLPKPTEEKLISSQKAKEWKEYRSQILRCTELSIRKLQGRTHHEGENLELVTPQLVELYVTNVEAQINFAIPEANIVFIIDDNMYYKSMRYAYYQLARQYNLGFGQVYFPCSVDEVVDRNSKRSPEKQVLNTVIREMASKIEPPNPALYNWEKHSINVDSATPDDFCLQIQALCARCLADPVQDLYIGFTEEGRMSRANCSKNLVHQADNIIRSIIAEKMSILSEGNYSLDVMRKSAKKYNEVKKNILGKLRSGKMHVPTDLENHCEDASKFLDHPVFRYFRQLYEDDLFSIDCDEL